MNNLGHVLLWFGVLALMVVHLVWGELPLSMVEVWRPCRARGVPNWPKPLCGTCGFPDACGHRSWRVVGVVGHVDANVVSNPLAGPGVLGVTSGDPWGCACRVAGMGGAYLDFRVARMLWGFGTGGDGIAEIRFTCDHAGVRVDAELRGGSSRHVFAGIGQFEALQTFVFWGMGTFGRAPLWQSLAMLGWQGCLGFGCGGGPVG